MNISVVIVAFESDHVLESLISKIPNHHEIIVVENSLQDGIKKNLESKFQNTKVFIPNENLGYSGGVNLGVEKSNHNFKFIDLGGGMGISYKENSFSMVNSMFREILNDKRFNVVFFDSYFKKINIKINQVNKLADSIDESDIVLFNYANNNDLQIIKKKFMKIDNKYLVNISTKQKSFLKSSKNIINFFSQQTLPVC